MGRLPFLSFPIEQHADSRLLLSICLPLPSFFRTNRPRRHDDNLRQEPNGPAKRREPPRRRTTEHGRFQHPSTKREEYPVHYLVVVVVALTTDNRSLLPSTLQDFSFAVPP
jgi:hypothetical protein